MPKGVRFSGALLLAVWLTAIVPAVVDAAGAPQKTGEASGGHAKEASAPMAFKADLAMWSLVVFLLFVFVLKKFAWGPLSAGLDKREAKIRDDIARAEDNRLQSEKLLDDYQKKLDDVQDEVREIIAEARRDAEHTKQDIIGTANREAEDTKDRAVAEINRARDQALKDVFDTISGQVASATEHVLGRSLSGEDQDRLVREALEQMTQPSPN